MKKILLSAITILLFITAIAQQPQIARVSSSGTTTIYTDIKQAIWAALDDDIIYLPGTSFSFDSIGISKRIHIIGSGHYPDSTIASGLSILGTDIYFLNGCNGASIQGFRTNNVYVKDDLVNCSITMVKCYLNGVLSAYGSTPVVNCTFAVKESIFQAVNGVNYVKYNIENCFILGNYINGGNGGYSMYYLTNSTVKHCVFPSNSNNIFGLNTIFSNNIFYGSISNINAGSTQTGSSFINNLFTNANSITVLGFPIEFGNVAEGTYNNTFNNVTAEGFNYTFDYHLKNTSVGNSVPGGVGIYSGNNPYNPNPFNPHIYYKAVAPVTNSQGQLQINVRVKAQ